jgi:hypothetical protein
VTLSPIASAWTSLGETLRAHPEKARAKYAPATATLESGLKCRVTGPSGERIETDMPPALGGAGSGPNPGWFFRASLAACCSTVIAAQAARLGINLTKLEVTVEGEGDNRGMLGLDDAISAGHSAIRTNVRRGGPTRRRGDRERIGWRRSWNCDLYCCVVFGSITDGGHNVLGNRLQVLR